jgi:hypothetical protein
LCLVVCFILIFFFLFLFFFVYLMCVFPPPPPQSPPPQTCPDPTLSHIYPTFTHQLMAGEGTAHGRGINTLTVE